jgi:hypothetical protein
MIAYFLIALLTVLIFLCISDVVQVVAQAIAEWRRARDLSRKQLAR